MALEITLLCMLSLLAGLPSDISTYLIAGIRNSRESYYSIRYITDYSRESPDDPAFNYAGHEDLLFFSQDGSYIRRNRLSFSKPEAVGINTDTNSIEYYNTQVFAHYLPGSNHLVIRPPHFSQKTIFNFHYGARVLGQWIDEFLASSSVHITDVTEQASNDEQSLYAVAFSSEECTGVLHVSPTQGFQCPYIDYISSAKRFTFNATFQCLDKDANIWALKSGTYVIHHLDGRLDSKETRTVRNAILNPHLTQTPMVFPVGISIFNPQLTATTSAGTDRVLSSKIRDCLDAARIHVRVSFIDRCLTLLSWIGFAMASLWFIYRTWRLCMSFSMARS